MAGGEVFAATVGQLDPGGLAERMGVRPGDVVLEVNGVRPRDILEWRRLVDELDIDLTIDRAGAVIEASGRRGPGEAFGATVTSALFDRIHTCDNHCEFCFIYQLPKGLRRSLYTKDDDYRLSFLFGNFTTLTRFTEADLERVIDEALSPLHVSVHATDPHRRAEMLRNPRGGTSLRWLGEILAAGIEVKVQIVLCPDVNDADVLDETLADLAEAFPGISDIAVVPLGLSRFNTEARMRVQTASEASAVIDQIDWWRDRLSARHGRPIVHAADEFYVSSGRSFPGADYYGGYTMVEDGVGLARSFSDEFLAGRAVRDQSAAGFFSSVDAHRAKNPSAYVRAVSSCGPSNPASDTALRGAAAPLAPPVRKAVGRDDEESLTVVTGECAADLLRSLVAGCAADHVDVLAVRNRFFGGNTSVAGLMCGEDLVRAIRAAPTHRTYLIPDVCLNDGRFLDGMDFDQLRTAVAPRRVEVMASRGHVLRSRIDATRRADRRASTGPTEATAR